MLNIQEFCRKEQTQTNNTKLLQIITKTRENTNKHASTKVEHTIIQLMFSTPKKFLYFQLHASMRNNKQHKRNANNNCSKQKNVNY